MGSLHGYYASKMQAPGNFSKFFRWQIYTLSPCCHTFETFFQMPSAVAPSFAPKPFNLEYSKNSKYSLWINKETELVWTCTKSSLLLWQPDCALLSHIYSDASIAVKMSVLVTIPEHNIPEHRASKWEIPDQINSLQESMDSTQIIRMFSQFCAFKF